MSMRNPIHPNRARPNRGNRVRPQFPARCAALLAATTAGCLQSGTDLGGAGEGPEAGPACRDEDCRDGDPCNGDERCSAGGTCVAGVPAPDGTDCTRASGAGTCRGGVCVPESCGDGRAEFPEECDDGNDAPGDGCENDCRFTCRLLGDCDDGNPCTREECVPGGTGQICRRTAVDGASCSDDDPCTVGDSCAAGSCRPGARPDCADDDPCTADRCDPGAGGTCVHEALPLWYVDADGDGWGAAGDAVCAAVALPGRAARSGDCCDADAEVHPRVEGEDPGYHTVPYACAGAAGGAPSFDYDCSGVEEIHDLGVAEPCAPSPDHTACFGTVGWCEPGGPSPDCRGVPACGESSAYQIGCEARRPWGGPRAADAGGPPADAGPAGADAGDPGEEDEDALVAKEYPSWDDAGAELPTVTCQATFEVRSQFCR
jgi:cysteine-rich repeat protein